MFMTKLTTEFEPDTIKKIRHVWDDNLNKYYYSVVDVVGMVTKSTDARNYWKVFKNRLKITQNKLVTECNQLKMPAEDGKMYLTDVLDSDNMLLLIQHITPLKVGEFRKIFNKIENTESHFSTIHTAMDNELSTVENMECKLSVDIYDVKDMYIIHAMLGGVKSEDISIIANYKNILIKGKRDQPQINENNYMISELIWGKFSREIDLPEEIDIQNIETSFSYGMLEIKIKKLDKSLTKIIKVKSQ